MDLLPKYLNEAQDANKMKRCAAFKKLNEFVSQHMEHLDAATSFSIIRQCLKSFEDASERCREESVVITTNLLATQGPEVLDWVLPAVVTRIGVAPVAEDSEEIRLLLLKLASKCLTTFPHDIGPRNYIDFFQVLLENCFQDPFPELKKEACRVTTQLCAIEPKQVKVISVPLAKALKTSCLLHKHSAVRSEAVRSFGTLLQHGASQVLTPGKDEPEARTTVSQLYILANDHSEAVRLAVSSVLCCALVDITERLEHHSRYFPHLLLLATDSFQEVRAAAIDVLTKVGKLYMLDNEDNRIDMSNRRVSMKDIAWYGDDEYPSMDFTVKDFEQYPILKVRPPLGIRYAVAEATRNMLERILSDVAAIDWVIPYSTNNRKAIALRILWVIIYHCEKSVVQFTERILGTLYAVLRDESEDVRREAALCAEILGKFLTPDQYLPFITAKPSKTENEEESNVIVQKSRTKTIIFTSANEEGAPAQCVPTLFSTAAVSTKCSILVALKYLVSGSKTHMTGAHAMQIVQALTNPDILESDNEQMLLSWLSTMSVIFTVFAERDFIATPSHPLPDEVKADHKQRTIDSILFYALLRAKSCEIPLATAAAAKCIEELSSLVTGSPTGIYNLHTQRLLMRYGVTMPVGSFADLLTHTTAVADLGSLLKSIFITRLGEVDFTLRVTDELRYFSVLEQTLWARKATFSSADLEELLCVVIMPLGGFQAGNVAHLFRKVGVNCLCALFTEPYRSLLAPALAADDMALGARVLALWASASDSDDGEMRLMCLMTLPEVCKQQMPVGSANEIVQSVLLRFDDSSDLIRLRMAAGLLAAVQGDGVSPHVLAEVNAQMVPLVKKVLVYMDDSEDTVGVRPVLLEVLKALGDLSPNIVVDLLQSALPSHHDPAYGQQVLDFIKARH